MISVSTEYHVDEVGSMSLRLGIGILFVAGLGAVVWSLSHRSPAEQRQAVPRQESRGELFDHPTPDTLHIRLNRLEFGHPRRGMVDPHMGLEARAEAVAGAPGRIVVRLVAGSMALDAWGERHFTARLPGAVLPLGVKGIARAELRVDPGQVVTVEMRADVRSGAEMVRLRLTKHAGNDPRSETSRVSVAHGLSPRRIGTTASSGGRGHLGAGGLGDAYFLVVAAELDVFLAEQEWRGGNGAADDVLSWCWIVSFEPDLDM